MRVLEWLVAHPERVAEALVIGTTAALGADQIGSHEAQIEAIRADQRFRGGKDYGARAGEGPHRGLGVARRIAQLSYRSRAELELRFGRSPQNREDPFAWKDGRAGGRFAIASYLDHHADKLARRFDANSTIALTQAMSHFDLGRDRDGVEELVGNHQGAVASSLARPPSLRITWASPSCSPASAAGSSRASIQVRMAMRRAGGSGRDPSFSPKDSNNADWPAGWRRVEPW
jgi:homoserine O-acetyltransferase